MMSQVSIHLCIQGPVTFLWNSVTLLVEFFLDKSRMKSRRTKSQGIPLYTEAKREQFLIKPTAQSTQFPFNVWIFMFLVFACKKYLSWHKQRHLRQFMWKLIKYMISSIARPAVCQTAQRGSKASFTCSWKGFHLSFQPIIFHSQISA